MQNPETIVVSVQATQGGVNIARRAVGLGNHTGVTDGTILIGEQKRKWLFLIIGIDGIQLMGH
jgi:hypothetical protein